MIVRNPLQLDPLATSSDEGLDVEGRHVRILYPDILTQDWNHLDGRSDRTFWKDRRLLRVTCVVLCDGILSTVQSKVLKQYSTGL